LLLATVPAWIVIAKLYGLYDRDEDRADHTTVDDILGVFHVVTVGAWLLLAGTWVTGFANPDLAKLTTFWAFAIVLLTAFRALARFLCRRTVTYLQNAIIVGSDGVGQLAARKILRHPEYGINVVGFVDDRPQELADDLRHVALLGPPGRLIEFVQAFDVDRVIFAFAAHSHEETVDFARSLKTLGVQVDIVPRVFELMSSNVAIHTVEGLPLLNLPPLRLAPSSRLLKRALDLTISVLGLVLLAPAFLVIALLIKRDSPGPVFFRQVRMGAGDRAFRIYKFRTMAPDADSHRAELAHMNLHAENGSHPCMFKAKDDPRVTRVGRLLRRYSLDELPQLINVVRGEMSLVGPRPLPLEEDINVGDWARRRLDLRPGITGLWQVLGRSDIPFEEMVKLDYLYVTGWSLRYDLRLLAQTLPVVFRMRGAY
jgi:exopolysaccharide biosynthesis polyprenyl glycosylphosphotransferase